MSLKRKARRTLTIQDKLDIIKLKTENETLTHQQIAEMYDCERSTVNKILNKQRHKLTEMMSCDVGELNVSTMSQATFKRMRLQEGRFHAIEKALYDWVTIARSLNMPISQNILKEKAQWFHEYLRTVSPQQLPEQFKASNGWLERFQQRFHVRLRPEHDDAHESSSVKSDSHTSDSFIERQPAVAPIEHLTQLNKHLIVVDDDAVDASHDNSSSEQTESFISDDDGKFYFEQFCRYIRQFDCCKPEDVECVKRIFQKIETKHLENSNQTKD